MHERPNSLETLEPRSGPPRHDGVAKRHVALVGPEDLRRTPVPVVALDGWPSLSAGACESQEDRDETLERTVLAPRARF